MRKTLARVLLTCLVAATAAAAPPPPGTVYFSRGNAGSNGGTWSMLADGTGKTFVASSYPRQPSHALHGSPALQRWYLRTLPVGGTFPTRDTCPSSFIYREELFAVSQDGLQVQLTDDPSTQVLWNLYFGGTRFRWGKDDSFVSFIGLTWLPVSPGDGNFRDNQGNDWLVESFVFKAPVDWSAGTPALAAATAPVVQGGLVPFSPSSGCHADADILSQNFSPSADRLAYEHAPDVGTPSSPGHLLKVLNIAAGTTQQIASDANDPEWAPNASKIAFHGTVDFDSNSGVWKINPDGTGRSQVTSGGTRWKDELARWSPDSQHLVFTRTKRQGALNVWLYDIYRVAATGGKITNLTSDLPDTESLSTLGWR